MVISNFVRKYTFAHIFLFSHNVIVNMCINVYFISVRELQNTLAHYIQQTQCNVTRYFILIDSVLEIGGKTNFVSFEVL